MAALGADTVGVKYIGSKASLAGVILNCIDRQLGVRNELRVLDVCTGTTRVAQAFRARGWTVTSSDLAWATEAYAHAFLYRTAASGARIPALLAKLQTIPPSTTGDWLTRHYCDVSGVKGGIVRMWKPANGRAADTIRNTIAAWEAAGEINHHEAMILICCLIFALDRVDSSVGIQQAYLKDWAKRASDPLRLEDLPYPVGPVATHLVGDCLSIEYPEADLAYIDPPYSSHSYATYYHIWDSITRWDKPAVGLRTNRRIDRVSKAAEFDPTITSPWNSKRNALPAFLALVARLPVQYVLVSYNNESIIPIDTLLKEFKRVYGQDNVELYTIPYQRNIMATIGNATLYKEKEECRTENTECLIWIRKGGAGAAGQSSTQN